MPEDEQVGEAPEELGEDVDPGFSLTRDPEESVVGLGSDNQPAGTVSGEDLEPLTGEEEEKTPTEIAVEKLREEGYDDDQITNWAIDLRTSPEIAQFYLDAFDRIKEREEELGGKARFFLHREKNGDLYLMKSPQLKSEGKSAWVQLLSSPQEVVGAHPAQAEDEDQRQQIIQMTDQVERQQERYREELLREVMLYPRYDEVDWSYSGGMHAPGWLTVSRILNTFWTCELPDPSVPQNTTFEGSEVSQSEEIARVSVEDRPGL